MYIAYMLLVNNINDWKKDLVGFLHSWSLKLNKFKVFKKYLFCFIFCFSFWDWSSLYFTCWPKITSSRDPLNSQDSMWFQAKSSPRFYFSHINCRNSEEKIKPILFTGCLIGRIISTNNFSWHYLLSEFLSHV